MGKIFEFGQKIDQYDYKVINERDARASAGIMFLLGILTLFYFFLSQNIFWGNVFTITFIVEFFIRVFINPIYAPYMILGSLIVSNQQPDWVEARPKKFAWILGALLGAFMSYFIFFDIMTPFRLLICLLCLILLYLEAVFGICLGCIVYKKLNYKLYNCPGGVCEVPFDKQSLMPRFLMMVFFVVVFYGIYWSVKEYKYQGYADSRLTQDAREFENEDDEDSKEVDNDCTPPQWAIDIGHKDLWKKHHNCE